MHFVPLNGESLHWTELVDGELDQKKMDQAKKIMSRNGTKGEWKPYGEIARSEFRGENFYDRLVGSVGRNKDDAEAMASQLLKEAGIPGIRYLDAGSRGSKEGTRNIVMFDEDLIKIADDVAVSEKMIE